MKATLKPVMWVGSSKKDLMQLPEDVRDKVGYALYVAQKGGKPAKAKPLKGLAGVMEIVYDYRTDTYRTVYTVMLGTELYVLHAFKKKSKKGIKTPKQEIDLIKQRLNTAKEIYKSRKGKKNGQ